MARNARAVGPGAVQAARFAGGRRRALWPVAPPITQREDSRIATVLNRSLPCLHHRSPDADFGSWHRERRPDQRWAEDGHIASRREDVIHGVVYLLPLTCRELTTDRVSPGRLQPPARTLVVSPYPRLPDP